MPKSITVTCQRVAVDLGQEDVVRLEVAPGDRSTTSSASYVPEPPSGDTPRRLSMKSISLRARRSEATAS
jgi:hypothetical protein